MAITDARNDAAMDGSMEDVDSTSFMSYLNGLSLLVLSIVCLWVAALDGVFPLCLFGEVRDEAAVALAVLPL